MSEDLGRARLGPTSSGSPADFADRPSDDAGPARPAGGAPGPDQGWAAPAGPDAPPGPIVGSRVGAPVAPRQPTAALGRPGGIPLRPMDVGDILDGTFGAIRRNPRTVIGLSALLVATQQVLAVAAEIASGDIPTVFVAFSRSASLQVVGGIGAIVGLVLSTLASALLTGMVVVVVSEDMFGRRVGAGDVWRRVRPRLGALVTASLIAGLSPFAGLLFVVVPGAGALLAVILLIVPGALLWGAWALTTPALVLERLGPIRALRRSWRLAFPAFWRVWGIRSLSVLLGLVMQSLLLLPFAALGALLANVAGSSAGDPLPLMALICVVTGSILGGTIAEPFLAGVLALLYVDRRMRAEGLDLVLQRRDRAVRWPGKAGRPSGHLPAAGTIAVDRTGP